MFAGLLDDFSVEITGKDASSLPAAAGHLPTHTRVNITALANESPQLRLQAACLVRDHDLVPVAHIAARRYTSADQLEVFLAALAAEGASADVFVVGGDPRTPHGPFEDSLAVISSGLLQRHGVRHVGVTGYPSGHPDIADPVLWQAIDGKVAALAEQQLAGSVITQFGFDADAVLDYVAAVRGRGITLPIRVGVPGPAGVRRLLGFATRFGVATGAGIARKYGLSLTNLIGTAGPDRFLHALAAGYRPDRHGTLKLHFYTFGGLAATAEWIAEFRRANT